MNEINDFVIPNLNFLEEVSYEEERKKYLDQLKEIRKQRERNICHVIPYCQVESPKVAYIYSTDEEVNPVYTETDGYGKVHIWVKDGVYNAGVEIEGRYIVWGDELCPKINVYEIIPDCIQKIIKRLVDEKNKI